jgi:hypothetical protein
MVKELKEMNDEELLNYFTKLNQSQINIYAREYRETFDEIKERMNKERYIVREKGIIEGKPANILLFTNQELMIMSKAVFSKLNDGLEGYTYEEIQKAFEKIDYIQKIINGVET